MQNEAKRCGNKNARGEMAVRAGYRDLVTSSRGRDVTCRADYSRSPAHCMSEIPVSLGHVAL